jgi:hypothetical protein
MILDKVAHIKFQQTSQVVIYKKFCKILKISALGTRRISKCYVDCI